MRFWPSEISNCGFEFKLCIHFPQNFDTVNISLTYNLCEHIFPRRIHGYDLKDGARAQFRLTLVLVHTLMKFLIPWFGGVAWWNKTEDSPHLRLLWMSSPTDVISDLRVHTMIPSLQITITSQCGMGSTVVYRFVLLNRNQRVWSMGLNPTQCACPLTRHFVYLDPGVVRVPCRNLFLQCS